MMRARTPAGWPTGHFAWMFAEAAQFAGGATSFLAEGVSQGHRAMFVADDPRPDLWPAGLIASGGLIVASTSEVYGKDRLVVAENQLTYLGSALAEARRDGYAGLRVAAENSSLVEGPERLAAWTEWEKLADEFMDENPVTGMCGFSWSSVDAERFSVLSHLHPVALVD